MSRKTPDGSSVDNAPFRTPSTPPTRTAQLEVTR